MKEKDEEEVKTEYSKLVDNLETSHSQKLKRLVEEQLQNEEKLREEVVGLKD